MAPYQVAGVGAVLTNLYAGRRIVYLTDFSAEGWLQQVRTERITSAMLVPTMLTRIVEHLDGRVAAVPTLGSIAYGGARVPPAVLERALASFPGCRVHQRLPSDRDQFHDPRADPGGPSRGRRVDRTVHTNGGWSVITQLERQAEVVLRQVRGLRRRPGRVVDTRPSMAAC